MDDLPSPRAYLDDKVPRYHAHRMRDYTQYNLVDGWGASLTRFLGVVDTARDTTVQYTHAAAHHAKRAHSRAKLRPVTEPRIPSQPSKADLIDSRESSRAALRNRN